MLIFMLSVKKSVSLDEKNHFLKWWASSKPKSITNGHISVQSSVSILLKKIMMFKE